MNKKAPEKKDTDKSQEVVKKENQFKKKKRSKEILLLE